MNRKFFSKLFASVVVSLLLGMGAWIIGGLLISTLDNALYSGAFKDIESLFQNSFGILGAVIGFGMRWSK